MNIYNKNLKFINTDNIHWNGSKLLSLEKAFNFAISGRIPGKSTFCLKMLYRGWYEKDQRFIYIKRLMADLTSSTIDDIAKVLNKFLDDDSKIKLIYSKGDLKSGVCDVYCYPENEKINYFNVDDDHLMFRILALSVPLVRIKGQIIPNLAWMFFDEFCVSKKLGEKYLPYEAEIFGQFYRTFYREAKNLRCLFCGNPYSKYSPYTAWLKMNLKDIKIGNIYNGENWAIEYIKISDELKQWVLEHDAMMDVESEELAMFSLEGQSIEDDNLIIVDKQPEYSRLLYLFKVNDIKLGVYKLAVTDPELECRYWIKVMPRDYNSTKKKIACFNAYELCSKAYIVNNVDKGRFTSLINAYRFYQVCYQNLEASALMEEVFQNLI